jgi:uncharacterized protein YcbK (DUF882 family)
MLNEGETMYPITRAVRRAEFLGAWASVFTALAIAPVPVLATAPEPWRERTLWLVRQGYDEEARVPFCRDGRTVFIPGYRYLSWLLRDHEVDPSSGFVPFSIGTLEALWEVQQSLLASGVGGPIVITSGYRTPLTNAHTEGAARNSEHLRATAVDMYVEGCSMRRLYDACYARAIAGGIGYYDTHIHMDTGPRRYWTGQVKDVEDGSLFASTKRSCCEMKGSQSLIGVTDVT